MPTKTKTAGSAHPTPEKSLEGLFSEALELVHHQQHDKAIAALEALLVEAGSHGQVGMAHSVRTYLSALKSRSEKKADTPTTPELAAQLALNRGAADEALDLLGKALATHSQDARLFYLKATAHAQKDEADAAAEALKQAVTLNQDFLHQFRLERDFDRVRSASAFISLGLE
jgi:predicted Zn-dependent protease